VVYILLFKDLRSYVSAHGKMPVEINFIYLENMEIYSLCQA